MNFVSKVIFDYNIKKGNICRNGQFTNLQDLLNVVHNSLSYDSFELLLTRTVNVIDTDAVAPMPIKLGTETLNFIVADNLTYKNDVRGYLDKNFDKRIIFNWQKIPDTRPIYFGGVLGVEELGPINPKTGERITYVRRYLDCRQMQDSDIMLDKNLKQIWPEDKNKGKTPDVLTKFLKRKKEKIYEG